MQNQSTKPAKPLLKPGDLVRFAGSYYVIESGLARMVMDTNYREGLILEVTETQFKVYSQSQVCFLGFDADSILISLINSLEDVE
tara:strand:+ start:2772 stop:3026 length:255 start_codon:yes stop_codon:yes gene_type:complete